MVARRLGLLLLVGIFGFVFTGVAMAQHGHGGHGSGGSASSDAGKGHSMSMKDRPVQSITVEGYKITLDIMDMTMHASMQMMKGNPGPGESDHVKSHAFMVVVQDTASKEIIADAKVNYVLVTPSGKKEEGKLDWSGDHYGRGFNAQEKGDYQVKFKIESGGMEREATFKYKIS